MLDDLDAIDWESKCQPKDNRPDAVPELIRRLAHIASPDTARQAYSAFLFAVGNNHAGTYYPIVLDTVPFLGRLLDSETPLVSETVLDILVDLVGSFEPDPRYVLIAVDGTPAKLRDQLRAAVSALSPTLHLLARDEERGPRTRDLAHDLLASLADA